MNISCEHKCKRDSIEDKFRLRLFSEFGVFVLIAFSHDCAFHFYFNSML